MSEERYTRPLGPDHQLDTNRFRARRRIALAVFAAAAAYFLLTEHRAHVIQALPWLLVLACPLMHVFMHGGHGHGHEGSR
jgi:hypothetical protein